MFYNLWFDDNDNNPYWHVGLDKRNPEHPIPDEWAFTRGEPIATPDPIPILIRDSGTSTDFQEDSVNCTPVISARLARILREVCPSDIQLIPALIDDPGEWYVLNVNGLINAIDYSNSVATFHEANHPRKPGKPRGFVRLIVDAEQLRGKHICRLVDWTLPIIVSDVIKQRCQAEKLTNMKFIPVEMSEWKRYQDNPDEDYWCYRPYRVATVHDE